jgi:endonuclease YncB( thermonuclease family)
LGVSGHSPDRLLVGSMGINRPFRAVPIKVGAHYRAKERRKRLFRHAVPALVLATAAAIGGVVGIGSTTGGGSMHPAYKEVVTGCTITDGDTIRCGGERIRLLGIDAPELPGHCRPGRNCAPGDPYASTSSLGDALTGTIRIERTGEDHYGRTLALITGDRGDLSCWQLQHGQAIYKPRWDDSGRVAHICPSAVG